ncbi:hypothetical protein GCM10009549_36450 [Streptomyces thermoalcalitolerans]|uniref:Uncharacterized protein n=1 Tax=Streptomyces thermoalcalitolerans TaxID=65605 RepID=A0ABN1NXD0_9ACTN
MHRPAGLPHLPGILPQRRTVPLQLLQIPGELRNLLRLDHVSLPPFVRYRQTEPNRVAIPSSHKWVTSYQTR